MGRIERNPIPTDGRLCLGQRVRVHMRLRRWKGMTLTWKRESYVNSWDKMIEPMGIIIGTRTVYEGMTVYEGRAADEDEPDYDFSWNFKRTQQIGVYLVAINMAVILRVLPGDLTLVEEVPHGLQD